MAPPASAQEAGEEAWSWPQPVEASADAAEQLRWFRDEAMALADRMNVALSGMAGRLPQSDNVTEFEEAMFVGRDMLDSPDTKRFLANDLGLPDRAGRIKDLTRFDYDFFGYGKSQADSTDYQLRMLLEVAYETILDSGTAPSALRGSDTSVFLGVHCVEQEEDLRHEVLGCKSDIGYMAQLATKVAHTFDLRGRVCSVDTACASSFCAFHEAAQAVAEGSCERALVLATNISVTPTNTMAFLEMQMLSPTGNLRYCDYDADGYAKGEAVVGVLLERSQLAKRVLANVLATVTNTDGYKVEGITFPSSKTQQRLMRMAKEQAGIHTNHIEYYEAHGTGTPAGDPQECDAISSVYCSNINGRPAAPSIQPDEDRNPDDVDEPRSVGPLLIGTSKSFIGHTEGSSGLCALLRIVFMLENELIYPTLHHRRPAPEIGSIMDGRLQVATKLRPLRAKIVPVSGYGFGGANAHAFLRSNQREQLDQLVSSNAAAGSQSQHPKLVLMFGRSRLGLSQFFNAVASCNTRSTRHCQSEDFLALLNSLHAHPVDRMMNYRGCLLLDRKSGRELARCISKCELEPLARPAHPQDCKPRVMSLLLLGLGARSPLGAFAGLEAFEPVWGTVERLAALLQRHDPSVDLRALVTRAPDARTGSGSGSPTEMRDACCALVAQQVALLRWLLDGAKTRPALQSVAGHSLGEISCALALGIIGETQAIMLAYEIGSALDRLRGRCGGRMVAVTGLGATEALVLAGAHDTVRLACVEGPKSVTLSGSKAQVEALAARLVLERPGCRVRLLESPLALHNSQIFDPSVQRELTRALARVLHKDAIYKQDPLGPPQLAWYSSLEGGQRKSSVDAAYFARALCNQLDLGAAVEQLAPSSALVQLGPCDSFEQQLSQLAHKHFQLVSFRPGRSQAPEAAPGSLLWALGRLYLSGVQPDTGHLLAEPGMKFPVRRQTPSLSSLFRWRHDEQLHVPVYPEAFAKRHDKGMMLVETYEERDAYLIDHNIEGRPIFPATAYVLVMWQTFSMVESGMTDWFISNEKRETGYLLPIEITNLRLYRAVLLSDKSKAISAHYDRATSRVHISEGETMVAEANIRLMDSSQDNLYRRVRKSAEARHAEEARSGQSEFKMTLNSDDVYKQLRLSGYDYGFYFRLIEEASQCGRRCKINYRGNLIPFLDCVLQSTILFVSKYAPPGSLLLPTTIEYIGLDPMVLAERCLAVDVPIDGGDRFREMIDKRLQFKEMFINERTKRRAQQHGQAGSQLVDPEQLKESNMSKPDEPEAAQEAKKTKKTKKAAKKAAKKERKHLDKDGKPLRDCYYLTDFEPSTNIVTTEGVVIRGLKASPAPRKPESGELKLECYKFVADTELPVEDEPLTGFKSEQAPYAAICDAMAQRLAAKLGLASAPEASAAPLADSLLESCKRAYLKAIFDPVEAKRRQEEAAAAKEAEQAAAKARKAGKEVKRRPEEAANPDGAKEEPEGGADEPKVSSEYDVADNGDRTLMSVLDQLQHCGSVAECRQRIRDHRKHLVQDLLPGALLAERLLRPLFETVVENCCQRRPKLKVLEVNTGERLVCGQLRRLAASSAELDPSLDCTLVHREPEQLDSKQLSAADCKPVRWLGSLAELLEAQSNLRDCDLALVRDSSCYEHALAWSAAPADQEQQHEPAAALLAAALRALRPGGYLLLQARLAYSRAEWLLQALAASDRLGAAGADERRRVEQALARHGLVAGLLEARFERALAEGAALGLLEVGRKSDQFGNVSVLFRVPAAAAAAEGQPEVPKLRFVRVQHEQDVDEWLGELQRQFPPEEESEDEDEEQVEAAAKTAAKTDAKAKKQRPEMTDVVWLCAVETRQRPVSGVVGLMKALKKELGSARLRCFYDECSFRQRDEPVSLDDIRASPAFKAALARDQLWSCVRQLHGRPQLGCFRHLSLSSYVNYERCRTDCQQLPAAPAAEDGCSSQLLPGEPCPAQAAFVNTAVRGDLSSFTWYETSVRPEQEADVVQVAYSALNFKDVLFATGRLPLDALPAELAMADCLLGMEFSGVDAAGKRVMGLCANQGLATHVLCSKDNGGFKFECPDWLSLRDAATIPCVYATVIMAMVSRAKMRRGESVLVHAGSGGVGQAAINLAGYHGLTVYATVGTQEKRDFLLREFPQYVADERIFSSRDCNFEHQIMAATKGRGVDIVINSLADDKLFASVRCMADGGRFLEIGKYDLVMNSKLELLCLNSNKTFHGIVLDKLFEKLDTKDQFDTLMDNVLDYLKRGLEQGYVKPIKSDVFQRNELERAFRFMATGKHMGKVLLEIDAQLDAPGAPVKPARLGVAQSSLINRNLCVAPQVEFANDKSYLVTGGLGGFGLELCKWLTMRGARYLTLTSRTGPRTGYQHFVLAWLADRKVSVQLVTEQQADASTAEGARKLLQLAEQQAPKKQLAGLFHLAMVLKDNLLAKLNGAEFGQVCRPKVDACHHLDQACRARPYALDYFVAFSSIACGIGSPGQANYAYANSCVERLCERRRSDGHHALVVQWGPVGDVGVAFENYGNEDMSGGMRPQRIPSCMAALPKLLATPFAVTMSLLMAAAGGASAGVRGDLVGAIMKVLGIKDVAKVNKDATLAELGLDSLMAVEIRHYIEREYDQTLTTQEVRALTVNKIREYEQMDKAGKAD